VLPVEPVGEVPVVELPERPMTFQAGPPDAVSRTFESFLAALVAATVHAPMVLILDHLEGLTRSDLRDRLHPHLIRAIADGKVPNLRLVVVLSTEQWQSRWPRGEDEPGTTISVDLVDAKQYAELFEDFLLGLDIEIDENHEQLRSALANIHASLPWRWESICGVAGSLVAGGSRA
jgi:hypothetical protein